MCEKDTSLQEAQKIFRKISASQTLGELTATASDTKVVRDKRQLVEKNIDPLHESSQPETSAAKASAQNKPRCQTMDLSDLPSFSDGEDTSNVTIIFAT